MTDNHSGGNGPSRRSFLKTAAVAGAALTAEALLPQVHAAGSDTIKVGIIGCGGRGSGAMENVLNAADNVEIVAIGDVFQFRVDGFRKHVESYAAKDEVKKRGNKSSLTKDTCYAGLDAYEKVIKSDVNYIILATPPGFRPTHLEAAVAAGKNIFTEKPVATDGAGIRKVLDAYDAADKKGLAIGAGTQRRHQAGYVETMKQVHDGAIGDVVALRCYWNQGPIWFRERKELADHGVKDSDLAYQLHNWYHFVWTCGDHICEQHIHNLDVCNWAMKCPPKQALGTGGRARLPAGDAAEVGHIYDNFMVDFEYPNGVQMLSMCRQIAGSDGNFQGVNGVSEALVGTKGTCQVNAYRINGKAVAGGRKGETDPYVQEHTDLIAAIRAGKPYNELKTVAESTLTAIMGRLAAYTGKVVSYDQALKSEAIVPEKLAWDMTLPEWKVAVPGVTKLG